MREQGTTGSYLGSVGKFILVVLEYIHNDCVWSLYDRHIYVTVGIDREFGCIDDKRYFFSGGQIQYIDLFCSLGN